MCDTVRRGKDGNTMRKYRYVVAGFITAWTSFPALANDGLVVGLTADQLLSCGRYFVESKQLEGKTLLKFSSALEGSAVVQAASDQSDGCEATVTIENGKAVALQTRQFDESVLSCFACQQVFSECKYLRR
jgi:hypothetical protein